jgi:NADP-dependent 3-hydroxy acid dehydrogenase YdfG
MDINGKTVIVTGASSGIGEATAIKLGELGAKVAIVARRRERLEKLAVQIEKSGGQALVIEADITDKKICHDLFLVVFL